MVEAVSDVILGKPAWTPPHSESLFVMNLIDQIRLSGSKWLIGLNILDCMSVRSFQVTMEDKI